MADTDKMYTSVAAEKKKMQLLKSEFDAVKNNKADKATTLAGYGIQDAYTKTEVNGLVDTPHQNYVTVQSTAQTTDATDVLPASGQAADTIYRVSNWDGSANNGAGAFDVTKYSEYAWDDASNPNKYVFLCVKTQVGEVFDISVYNNNATYPDLATALGTNGANVPQEIRRGGMTVKFVLTSDHKYVQCRYMGTSTANADFANVANWQGVDSEPKGNSKNMVEGGGIAHAIGHEKVSYMGSSTSTHSSTKDRLSIDIKQGDRFFIRFNSPVAGVLYFDGNDNGWTMPNNVWKDITAPNDITYIGIYNGTLPSDQEISYEVLTGIAAAAYIANLKDDVPTKGSDNAVKSSGVYAVTKDTENLANKLYTGVQAHTFEGFLRQVIVNDSNTIASVSTNYYLTFTKIKKGDIFLVNVEQTTTGDATEVKLYYSSTRPTVGTTGLKFIKGEEISINNSVLNMEYIADADGYLLIWKRPRTWLKYRVFKSVDYADLFEYIEDPSINPAWQGGYFISADKDNADFGEEVAVAGLASSAYGCTGYINIEGCAYIKCVAYMVNNLRFGNYCVGSVFYDENKQPLEPVTVMEADESGWTAINICVKVPSGAKYIRMSGYHPSFSALRTRVSDSNRLLANKKYFDRYVYQKRYAEGSRNDAGGNRLNDLLLYKGSEIKLSFESSNIQTVDNVACWYTDGTSENVLASVSTTTGASFIAKKDIEKIGFRLYQVLSDGWFTAYVDVIGSVYKQIDNSVSYTEEQELTDAQKVIAQTNIGIGGTIFNLNPGVHNALVSAKHKTLNYPQSGFNSLLSFLVMTDIHADWPCFERGLKYADDESLIDGVFVLGDTCETPVNLRNYDYPTKTLACTKPVLTIPGNHEVDNTSSYAAFSDAEFIAKFYTSEMVAKSGDIHPEGKVYWYRDFTREYLNASGTTLSSTLRVIGFDEAEYSESLEHNAWCVTQAQIDWLVNLLENTPSDYYVVILSHSCLMPYNKLTPVTCKFTPTYFNDTGSSYSPFNNPNFFINIIRGWIDGTSVVTSATQSSGEEVSVNHTFSSAHTNKFVGFVSGHTHRDFIFKVTDRPDMVQVVLNCTSSAQYQQNGDVGRDSAGKAKDCITVFTYDWFNHSIKLVRVGADVTAAMTKRDFEMVKIGV